MRFEISMFKSFMVLWFYGLWSVIPKKFHDLLLPKSTLVATEDNIWMGDETKICGDNQPTVSVHIILQ